MGTWHVTYTIESMCQTDKPGRSTPSTVGIAPETETAYLCKRSRQRLARLRSKIAMSKKGRRPWSWMCLVKASAGRNKV
eukprot:6193747-Pleurochrysis_carterae.AAC.4